MASRAGEIVEQAEEPAPPSEGVGSAESEAQAQEQAQEPAAPSEGAGPSGGQAEARAEEPAPPGGGAGPSGGPAQAGARVGAGAEAEAPAPPPGAAAAPAGIRGLVGAETAADEALWREFDEARWVARTHLTPAVRVAGQGMSCP